MSDSHTDAHTETEPGTQGPARCGDGERHGGGYSRFGAMIVTSMAVMYGVMYLNTAQWGHVEFSETRFFMTFLMGATVDDRSYMRAMIPHHSIAVLTSSNADIDDARVRELADRIIDAQCREIAEMHWLIDDIAANGVAATDTEAAERRVPEFSEEC